MTSLPDRQKFVSWFEEAVAGGARKAKACSELGVSLRTIQRWTGGEEIEADARTTTVRPSPANALTEQERAGILSVCNSSEFASLPPSQIVPRLADRGCYLASESTFYRVLRNADQQHRHGKRESLGALGHHASDALMKSNSSRRRRRNSGFSRVVS